MRILIVEDCTEIRSAMALAIKGVKKDIDVTQASNGLEAVQILEGSAPFDIVFCDFNMPKMNGGQVYLKLKAMGHGSRFVLVSSDSPDTHPDYFLEPVKSIEKPNIFKPLIAMISKACGDATDYISISLRLVKRLNLNEVDLFVRLSDKKFIKVVKAGSTHFSEEIEQLKRKPLSQVYIEINKAQLVFKTAFDANKNVFESELTPQEHIDANEVLLKAVKIFGATEETQKMVDSSVSAAIARISKCKELDELVSGFDEGDYITLHGTILAHVAGYVCSLMEWCVYDDLEKLALAALLHDLTVDDSELAKAQTRQEMEESKKTFDAEQIYRYIYHPVEAGKLARSFDKSLIPPGVDKLIIQHHERPDGSGFPKKITYEEIEPLSAVFIVSHAIAIKILKGLGGEEIKKEIDLVLKSFSGGAFDDISQTLREKIFI